MSATVILLCGLPGSGKTTFAKSLEEKGALRLTLDEWLIGLCSYSYDSKEYAEMAQKLRERFFLLGSELVKKELNVVLDFSLWSRELRQEWTDKFHRQGIKTKLYYLAVSLDEARKRLQERNKECLAGTHQIEIAELERFYHDCFEAPSEDEGIEFEVVAKNLKLSERDKARSDCEPNKSKLRFDE